MYACPNKYQHGKVYKIVNQVDDLIYYVGSTYQSLPKRLYDHKKEARQESKQNRPLFKHLNSIGWDFAEIILIENHPCADKAELERRERHYIETLKPLLNSRIPTRSKAEYLKINAEQVAARNKRYQENNAEQIAAAKKKYYDNNADRIAEYRSRSFTCDCGSKVSSISNKARHEKTTKHQQWLEAQPTPTQPDVETEPATEADVIHQLANIALD